jgi:hypothetical protein
MGFRGGSAFAALVLGFGGNGGPVSGPMLARFLAGTGFAAPGLPDGRQAGERAGLAEVLA